MFLFEATLKKVNEYNINETLVF